MPAARLLSRMDRNIHFSSGEDITHEDCFELNENNVKIPAHTKLISGNIQMLLDITSRDLLISGSILVFH